MRLSSPGGTRFAVLAATLLALLATAAPARAQAPGERPNFLHVLTDDQTLDSLAYMPRTLGLVGARGTSFTNFHAVQPLCCPSRASFLTGQYPHNHGVLDNLAPYGYPAMDFSRTLYTAMDGAGYDTGWIGKVLNGSGNDGLVPAPGFDEWLVPLGGEAPAMFDYELSDNGVRRDVTGTYQNELFAQRAQQFIASHGSEPFLLTLALASPHWSPCGDRDRCPPIPDPRDAGSFAGAHFPFPAGSHPGAARRAEADAYWQRELESLQSVDRIVGALVDQLRSQGELRDTYVIFESDNGLLHGEHGIFDKNVAWDRSVRVPLLIRGPGFRPGTVRDDLTANVDLPRTILDAAGVPPPRPPDGYSLLGGHRRKQLLLERPYGFGSRLQQPWQELKTATGWTYWRNLIDGRRHLYDMSTDPWQLHNLIKSKPGVARRLDRRLSRVAACAAPCP